MNDISYEALEDSRPNISSLEAISFCLLQLYNDNEHGIDDYVVGMLTYEELIGALLLARDEAEDFTDVRGL